jgi:hypothetical protein
MKSQVPVDIIAYECHITVDGLARQNMMKMQDVLEGTEWHYSFIVGDPDLGPGRKSYATAHYDPEKFDRWDCMRSMQLMAYALQRTGFNVVRQKIEAILYDHKEKTPDQKIEG